MNQKTRLAGKRTAGQWIAKLVVLIVAGSLGLTGCANNAAKNGGNSRPEETSVSPSLPPVPPVEVTLTEADGKTSLVPSSKVKVKVKNGKVSQIYATDSQGQMYSGGFLNNVFSPGRKLPINETMTFNITTVDENGITANQNIAMETVKANESKFSLLYADTTVGTAMPIIVQFPNPISEELRPEIESSLSLKGASGQPGAWGWINGGRQIVYRPKDYWVPGTEIFLNANLTGVQASNDSYFVKNATSKINIGANRSALVEIDKYRTTLFENGKQVAQFPSTAGKNTKETYVTRSGKKVISEKRSHLVMDSSTVGVPEGSPGYYRTEVDWALRVTNTGEFIHAAPWSVSSQGNANVSHGCVGLNTANAKRVYNFLNIGDMVEFTGSNRSFKQHEGIAVWEYSWAEWQKLSSLK